MKTYIHSIGLAAVLMAAEGTGSGAGKLAEPTAKEKALAEENAKLKKQLEQANAKAEAAKTDADANAAKAIEKANAAAEGSAFKAEILAAVAKLRHVNNADWQEDGRPSLKRIIQLAGNDKITAEDVDKVAGGVRRETMASADDKSAALRKGEDADVPEELTDARVRAIDLGQYGGKLREVGEEFTYSGPKKPWFIKLKG